MSLRIGMIAPITHPYPPPGYGPWERVAHDLTEALVAAGHEVTLFAAGTAVTAAELVATVPDVHVAGSLDPRLAETEHIAAAIEVAAGGGLDVVHSHLHVHVLPYTRLVGCPVVTTLHGAGWDRAHHRLLLRYAEQPFVSLSHAERAFLPELNYVATIPNGIRADDFPIGAGAGGYLAFVGRIAPEKAVEDAIAVAELVGRPLRIAGIIEPRHSNYFEGTIAPRLRPGDIEYVGSLGRGEVARFVGDAAGLLMPLRWDEPFGLVVVESLATGTPVIAWRRGAMAEIVRPGVTGHLVDSVDEAVEAVSHLDDLDRTACRNDVLARFSDTAMAAGYEDVYRTLTASPPPARRPTSSRS